jgi:hypothetical protein
MASSRFPRAKYLRQLHEMRAELWWWCAGYEQATHNRDLDPRSERYYDRAAVLKDAMHWLDQLAATLEGMPRLS